MMFRSALLLCLVAEMHSMRVTSQASLARRASASRPVVGDEVSFDFMGVPKEKKFPSHRHAAFFGEWLMGNRTMHTDKKEEIVKGHTCQDRGGSWKNRDHSASLGAALTDRDQIYYASSFCYWLPEISNGFEKSHWGVQWEGGRYPAESSMGTAPLTPGKCLKLSVCHNNARGTAGHLSKHTFTEELELPASCLRETQIERTCVDKYHKSEGAQQLKASSEECSELKTRYDEALGNYNKAFGPVHDLPSLISHFPSRIKGAEDQLAMLKTNWSSAEQDEEGLRDQLASECAKWSEIAGLDFLFLWGSGESKTQALLSHFSADCSEYFTQEKRHMYSTCQTCQRARKLLSIASERTAPAQRAFRIAGQKVHALKARQATKEQEWKEWQEAHPGFESAEGYRKQQESQWLPRRDLCMKQIEDYKHFKAQSVQGCAPKYYYRSCEKACVEMQAAQGCGVVEGSKPGDASGMGGVTVQCQPPEPSWVLAPFTYGVHENTAAQCKRIEANQKMHYAQKVLKSGWIWKKGRMYWEKRYFVLESGNAVRSPLIRYWRDDPTTFKLAELVAGKEILLHDAKSVTPIDAKAEYGWETGEECFVLEHFYRDYKLCTVVGESTSAQDPASLETRDEWVQLIRASIDIPPSAGALIRSVTDFHLNMSEFPALNASI